MHLTFIRHGQSYVNLPDWRDLADLDAGLTELGQRQAAALRDWFYQIGAQADVLYSSTLRRACETARYVSEALGQEPIFDDHLREIASCYADGQPIAAAQMPRNFIDQWSDIAPFAPRSPDLTSIESWMQFRVRLAQFVDTTILRHPGQQVYVVAHAAVIAAVFDNIFNVGPYHRCEAYSHNTSLTRFWYHPQDGREPWALEFHNRTEHLTGDLFPG